MSADMAGARDEGGGGRAALSGMPASASPSSSAGAAGTSVVPVDPATIDFGMLSGEWGGVSRNSVRKSESTIWTHTRLEFNVAGRAGVHGYGTLQGNGFSLWVRTCFLSL